MIFEARQMKSTICHCHTMYADLNPRRAIEAFESGIPQVKKWDNWGDLSLYEKSKDITTISNQVIDKDRLQDEINAYFSIWQISPQSELAKKALRWVGLRE